MTASQTSLTRQELRSVLVVSLIMSIRLLGVFLLLPIFSVYGMEYKGATLPAVGLAFGMYPLVQGLLQIPYGWASDRFGRKRLLVLGLALFSAGSLYAALATDITHLVIARAVQGSGAVGAVAMASLGDLTRPGVRAQAFTITGLGIGAAFVAGLLGGPALASLYGFNVLFLLLAALGFLALLVAVVFYPETVKSGRGRTVTGLSGVLDGDLKSLYLAALMCSLTLNLFFFLYPLSWKPLGVGSDDLWRIYLVVLLPSLVFVFPYIRRAERRGNLGPAPLVGYVAMAAAFVLYLLGGTHRLPLYVTASLFFLGYSLYQAFLPAFITQRTPQERRGAVLGFYNLSGFIGASVGGMVAGGLFAVDKHLPLLAGLALLGLWLLLGLPSYAPPQGTTLDLG